MSNGPASPERMFERRLTTATLGLLFVVLVIHLLQLFARILVPLLIAALIAYALLPVHRWLVRRGIGPGVAYFVLVGGLLAVFLFLGQAIYGSIISLGSDRLNEYQSQLDRFVGRIAQVVEETGLPGARERMQQLIAEITLSSDELVAIARGLVSAVLSTLTYSLVVFIYLVFLLVEKISFPRRMALAFGDVRADNIVQVARSINEAIVNYIAVKAWISLLTALLSLFAFLLLRIELAVLWAFLIFLLNFIPYLGGLVAMAPPVVLAFIDGRPLWEAFALIGALVVIQIVTGQLVEPRMAGSRLNLSPLLILLSLGFWGALWGIPGMLLAVPLTVVCKIVLDHIGETRPIATLMSNL